MFKLVDMCDELCTCDTLSCRYVITCGGDSDVRTFEDIDEDSCAEFSVASDQVTAIVCWYTSDQVRGYSKVSSHYLFSTSLQLSISTFQTIAYA